MASVSAVFLCVINSFLSVFGSMMNILVTVVILQNAELQKGLNFLIVSLTAADLGNCLLAQPLYVYYLGRGGDVSNGFLVAFELIAYISLHAVFSNFITITYHRMKALSQPFTHLLQVSPKNLLLGIVLTWIVSIIIGVVLAPPIPGNIAGAYFHAVMAALLVITYMRILWVAKRKRSQIAEQVGTGTFQAAAMEQENAAVVTSSILVGVTILCFFPDIVLDLIDWEEAQVIRREWNYTLLFTCAALNPCIVIWRSQQLRRALLQTIHIEN